MECVECQKLRDENNLLKNQLQKIIKETSVFKCCQCCQYKEEIIRNRRFDSGSNTFHCSKCNNILCFECGKMDGYDGWDCDECTH